MSNDLIFSYYLTDPDAKYHFRITIQKVFLFYRISMVSDAEGKTDKHSSFISKKDIDALMDAVHDSANWPDQCDTAVVCGVTWHLSVNWKTIHYLKKGFGNYEKIKPMFEKFFTVAKERHISFE